MKLEEEQLFISIIIPVYNVEKYIDECITSICKQKYRKFEVILVDDGSTDSSSIICDQYAQKYEYIRVIHQKNQGVSSARNRGIQESSGEYIAFVDPDDVLSECYLSSMVHYLQTLDTDMVIVGYTNNKQDLSTNVSSSNKSIEKYSANMVYSELLANGRFDGYLWNRIFKRSVIIENGIYFPDNIKVWEDLYFVASYLKHISKIASVNDTLYFYRLREDSATAYISIEKLKSKVDACELLLSLENNKNAMFYKAAEGRYIEALIEYSWRAFKETSISKEEFQSIISKIKGTRCRISYKYRMKYMFMLLTYRKKLVRNA